MGPVDDPRIRPDPLAHGTLHATKVRSGEVDRVASPDAGGKYHRFGPVVQEDVSPIGGSLIRTCTTGHEANDLDRPGCLKRPFANAGRLQVCGSGAEVFRLLTTNNADLQINSTPPENGSVCM